MNAISQEKRPDRDGYMKKKENVYKALSHPYDRGAPFEIRRRDWLHEPPEKNPVDEPNPLAKSLERPENYH